MEPAFTRPSSDAFSNTPAAAAAAATVAVADAKRSMYWGEEFESGRDDIHFNGVAMEPHRLTVHHEKPGCNALNFKLDLLKMKYNVYTYSIHK